MTYKKHPPKPLFTDEKEVELFLNLLNDLDDENHIKMAKELFVDGKTCEEVANSVGYSRRQTERLKIKILKVALKRAIKKMIRIGG